MRSLVWWSLLFVFSLSIAAMGVAITSAGQPPLWLFMVYLLLSFFCVGILFGNNNALAMQPLGRMAGMGAAVVGSLSTLISVPLGTMIGRGYNGTIIPLVAGIAILAGLSIFVVRWAESE
jgi:DHA1 family bicyclomycin/chloramphenicol resistance-like MFS transporter